jgi:hypothetical protein
MIPGAVSDVAALEARHAELRLAMARTCGHLNAMHGELVGLVSEAIAIDAWSGYRSPEHWLTVYAGISNSSARRIVAVARRQSELPATTAALARGELTIDQAEVVARFVPAHNDSEVVSFATAATVSQLRSTLRRYPFDHPTDDHGPVGEGNDPPHGPTVVETSTARSTSANAINAVGSSTTTATSGSTSLPTPSTGR